MQNARSFARLAILIVSVLCVLGAIAPAQTESVVYSFTAGNNGDNTAPDSPVIFDSAGTLYGSTMFGMVYQLTQSGGSWNENVLYDFGHSNYSIGGVIFDSLGNLYGTTAFGGTSSNGSVFELSPSGSGSWTLRILHSFSAQSAGLFPSTAVAFDSAGNLYGVTQQGGNSTNCINGCGVAFELKKGASGWQEQLLHSFGNGTDGQTPGSPLLLDAAGNLYGTTQGGGSTGNGTVFELIHSSSGWKERILHTFQAGPDGKFPMCNLRFDASGNIFGVTANGGPINGGTVFELSPQLNGTWTYKVLYRFGRSGDVTQPFGSVAFDSAGNLYGAADGGGTNKVGGVWKLTPQASGSWTETVLHSFGSSGDGMNAQYGVTIDASGNLFGTTSSGGANGDGIVFEVTP
jgi:uncharacterized repeat protein (TIGR03803 family)